VERKELRILLVENSSTLRDLLVSVLRRRFHVFGAPNGWEALQMMVERPDLIVTEVNLPCVDAADMLRHARRIAAEVPVLVLYRPEERNLLAAAQAFQISSLAKPFRIADLISQVESHATPDKKQRRDSIVVVSPDATERQTLYDLLDTRYPTHVAASAQAAMALTDAHFDLLVVDIPDGDYPWQDVVTSFRENNKFIKVLAVTDGKNRAVLPELRRVGADSAIRKPYAVDNMLCCVRGLLGIKELDGRLFKSVYRKVAV
jgi:DNA-binding response OmpR family regulator